MRAEQFGHPYPSGDSEISHPKRGQMKNLNGRTHTRVTVRKCP